MFSFRFKATLWLSEAHPLSLAEQVTPIIDLMAISNAHFAKLRDFITLRLPPGFPVKIGERQELKKKTKKQPSVCCGMILLTLFRFRNPLHILVCLPMLICALIWIRMREKVQTFLNYA